MRDPRAEGYDAAYNGTPKNSCPYEGLQSETWYIGWDEGNAEQARQAGEDAFYSSQDNLFPVGSRAHAEFERGLRQEIEAHCGPLN